MSVVLLYISLSSLLLLNVRVLCVSETAADSDLGTLLFANVLYRHGDRTPIDPYPLDPYGNLSYWPVGWGQLTNVGKEQHYKLGMWLRSHYASLLPSEYSPKAVSVRSTDVDRTLMSAECHLVGLFPPGERRRWNPQINWQPVPIHTTPSALDELLAAQRPCSRYEYELAKVKASPEMKAFNLKNKKLYEYLSEHTGLKIHDVEGAEKIYDTLFIEELYNMTLPEWTHAVYPDKLRPLAGFSFVVSTMTKELQRLKAGPLLGRMVRNLRHKSRGDTTEIPTERVLAMFSAHDSTIANLLNTLGVFEPHSPPYRAMVMVELRHSKAGEHQVTVFYKNTTGEPRLLTIPGCLPACPLNRFVSLTRPVIPVDWQMECNGMTLGAGDFAFNSVAIAAVVVSVVLAFLLVVSMLVGVLYWRKQKTSTYWYHRVHQDSH